jgi:hypothetical protein
MENDKMKTVDNSFNIIEIKSLCDNCTQHPDFGPCCMKYGMDPFECSDFNDVRIENCNNCIHGKLINEGDIDECIYCMKHNEEVWYYEHNKEWYWVDADCISFKSSGLQIIRTIPASQYVE